MSPTVQTAIGLALVLIGWLMGRWASRYDIKGWFTSAIWRAVFRQDWRKAAAKGDLGEILESDPELKRTIKAKADSFNADAARLGQTRATAKHAGLFALAYALSFAVWPLVIVGLLLTGHAIWRVLG